MCYKKLKSKFSTEYDEIPEYVVQECVRFIRGALKHIYNNFFNIKYNSG